VSHILGKPCYKAGYRKAYSDQSCLSSSCSVVQKELCLEFARSHPSGTALLLKEVAGYLDIPIEHVGYSDDLEAITVKGTLHQEQQSFLVQATSFPVIGDCLVKNLEWTANNATAPTVVLG
jgi:hypothetical protein